MACMVASGLLLRTAWATLRLLPRPALPCPCCLPLQEAYAEIDKLLAADRGLKGALFWQWFNNGQEAPASEGGGRGLFGELPPLPAACCLLADAACCWLGMRPPWTAHQPSPLFPLPLNTLPTCLLPLPPTTPP